MNAKPYNRLPSWFKQEIPDEKTLRLMNSFREFKVNTVCQEAKCPNITSCFRNNEVTFMILGQVCTRNCRFCNVDKSKRPVSIEPEQPRRIKELVGISGLDYVVITSVARDDLSDGGAAVFAKTIESIHQLGKDIRVEALIPDFRGSLLSLRRVLESAPYVLAHNIETVKRLYPELRPEADYGASLNLLRKAKDLRPQVITKSSIMLGLGETRQEVVAAMHDLIGNNCDCLTLGQYLAPSSAHYPVKEFIAIEQFNEYKKIADSLGFKSVLSGPKVRSSYQARKMQESADSSPISWARQARSILCTI